MVSAQRRVLFLVAVSSWLLLDSLRTAGPLLSALFDNYSLPLVLAITLGAFAGGGVLGWLAARVGRNFGHGVVVLYLLAVLAVLRLGLPFINGGWLIAAGLYLMAFAIAAVVMSARAGLATAGSGTVLAGTALGAAVAVFEHTVLRTWDAVWRADLLGWIAMITVAILAITAGYLCRRLEPVAGSRGWWAFGLYWALLGFAMANVAWVNAQTDMRMSAGSILTMVSLAVAAGLAAQAHRTSRTVTAVIMVAGVVALAVVMLRPGTGAALALPIATAATTLAAAHVLRGVRGSAVRSLVNAIAFGLAILAPALVMQLDYVIDLGVPRLGVAVAAGVAVLAYGGWRAWIAQPLPGGATDQAPADARTPSAWISPGVPVSAALVAVAGVGVGVWTHYTYETPRTYSADFVQAPHVATWNLHYGITHEGGGGPRVDLAETAAALNGMDVSLLQEVQRGWLLGGGTDMVEYLAGELRLPYTYAPAHDRQFGNLIITSRPHANARTLDLEFGEGPQRRTALAVDFMGATYASAHLQSAEGADETRLTQAQQLVEWLDGPQPVVVGGDFGTEPGSPAHRAMIDAGYISAQEEFAVTAPTYIGPDLTGEQAAQIDYLFGRGVEFTEFELLALPWSDHWQLVGRVATGAVAPTEPDADPNEVQAVPTPTATASAVPSPSPSE